MAAERTCPQCGSPLDPEALEGLCPKCVGRAAFDHPSARPPFSADLEDQFARLKPEEAGERIGNYKLLQQIGEGGFGTVWMAEQTEPVRRRVALKIIKLGMDTKEVVARFEQERQALAMMDHPNIAKVFDAGATQWGRPFFVMELVRGIKITDYCDQANLPTADRLQLFIQTCHAVQHAHQKGIIHRDLKPSNVLVTLHDGVPVPKVIDFGVAKATQQQRLTDLTLFTQFEQMVGTPLYMSPEQAEMSGLDIDTRTDIYSLGVLLYELLTGRTPFDPEELMQKGNDEIRRTIREQEPQTPSMFLKTMAAERRATVAQHRQSDPAALTRMVRGDLDWIVMKALEKDRARRYETANGLAKDIERHLASEPVLARPASRLYRFRRTVRRNKLAFGTGAVVAVALLSALVNLLISNARIVNERNQKDAALQQRGAALADAKERLFDALLQRARAGRFSRQMGQRFDSLDALAEAARIHPDERLRDEAIAAMALPDLHFGPAWSLDHAYAADANYRVSAGGRTNESTITVRSIPDRREIWHTDTGRKLFSMSMSGDGRFLAEVDQARTLHVWRIADGRQILAEPIERCGGIAFTADSGELAIGQGGSVVHLELATGREIKRWKVANPVHSLAFRAPDRQLAVGYIGGTEASVYDAADGALVAHLPVGSISGQVVAWHPDGMRLAISGSDPRIQIWDVPAKRRLAILEGHVQQVTFLSFHPGGELLASVAWEAVVRLWHPASGRPLMQLPHSLTLLRFSANGRWLGAAMEGEGGRLVEVEACPEYRTIVSSLGAQKDEYFDGSISPDGSLLALGMKDGARIWELASGRELAFLKLGAVHSAIFRPDARELITCGDAGVQIFQFEASANGLGPPETQTITVPETKLVFHGNQPLGPAQKIPLPFTPTRASCSRDGRLLAVVSESTGGALVLDLATGAPRTSLLPHPAGGFIALSPDGAWLATSGWRSPVTRFWDARTGEKIEEWKAVPLGTMSFTPDSRTLIATLAEHFSFRDVQTLQPIRRLPRGGATYTSMAAVSTDGRLIAPEATPGIIHLTEAATGRTVARLTDPSGARATWMSFTPDGTQLVTCSFYAKAIHVWNLRRIRTRLKSMGLDWDWPEFPAAKKR